MLTHISTISSVSAFIRHYNHVQEFIVGIRPNYHMERINAMIIYVHFEASNIQLFLPVKEIHKTDICKDYMSRTRSEADWELVYTYVVASLWPIEKTSISARVTEFCTQLDLEHVIQWEVIEKYSRQRRMPTLTMSQTLCHTLITTFDVNMKYDPIVKLSPISL